MLQIDVSYTTTRDAKLKNVTLGRNKLLNNLPIWSFFGGRQAVPILRHDRSKSGSANSHHIIQNITLLIYKCTQTNIGSNVEAHGIHNKNSKE